MKSVIFTILALIAITLLSCSKKDSEELCSTCPEVHPAATAAMEYINAHKDDFDLRPQFDEMLIRTIEEDQFNMTHVRMDQYYIGVPVIGGELIVHLDSDLKVESVSGATVPGIVIDTKYKVEASAALNIALQHFKDDGYLGSQDGVGGLTILRENTVDHLCWWFKVISDDKSLPREYFIDANTGTVVKFRNLIVF